MNGEINMEFIDPIMKWLVMPLTGFVAWLLKRINVMNTELKVLESKIEAQAEASKQSHASIQQTMAQVIAKLDSIETYLRKDK